MVRIFIIGAGVIAREHAAASHLLHEPVELHVFDPNAEALGTFKSKEPEAIVHDTLDDLLAGAAEPNDIVVVATPPGTHAELALRGFASGRHVLSEKPLGMDLRDARRMLEAARGAGKLLGDCSVRFLGYQAETFIRDQLAAGALGELYHATCRHRVARGRSGIEYQPSSRWFLDRSKSGGGVLMDWSVYDLATLFDLLEPVKVEVRDAWTAQPRTASDPTDSVFDVETHVGAAMHLTLATGKTLSLSYERASCTHGKPGSLLEIEGTEGAMEWEWLPYINNNTAAILGSDENGQPRQERHEFGIEGATNWHHRPLVSFHERVARGSTSDSIVNERALFNFAVVQAIYDVASTGERRSVDIATLA